MPRSKARVRLWPPLLLLLAAVLCTAEEHVDKGTIEDISTNPSNEDQRGYESIDLIKENEFLECPRECNLGSNSTLRFQSGQRYVYAYEATVKTAVGGQEADGPTLRLAATVTLDAINDCQLRMQLEDARVEQRAPAGAAGSGEAPWRRSTRGAQLATELERFPLVFSFDDGRVTGLCRSSRATPWALNAQRAIVSALQSSGRGARDGRDALIQNDVSGLCLTKYERELLSFSESEDEDSYRLYRLKDTQTCAHRSSIDLPLPAGAVPPAVGSRPPLKGEIICVQHFVKGVLQEAECREVQMLRPFGIQYNINRHQLAPPRFSGAFAEAQQKLFLINTTQIPAKEEEEAPISLDVRDSLRFTEDALNEDEGEEAEGEDADETAMAALRHLSAAVDYPAATAPIDASEQLRRLTAALRRADFPALERLFRRTTDAPALRRLLLETLPGARTAAAAALATHLASSGSLAPRDVDDWLAARALRGAPSADELAAFSPLVTATPASAARPRTLLAAGALIHAHCAKVGVDACSRPRTPAADLAAHLERALGHRCRPRAGA